MPSNTPTHHPPAAALGIPKAVLRFGLRWGVIMVAAVVVWLVCVLALIRVLPPNALLRGAFVLPASVILVYVPGLPWFLVRFTRLRKKLRSHPDACLNCAYETTDPAGVCPECAHRSDRSRLNRFWRRAVGAGDAARPPEPEA